MAMNHRRYIAWYHSSARVLLETLHGDESSPLHCVVPFNRTGYHCNVAGKGLYLFQILNFLLHFFDDIEVSADL